MTTDSPTTSAATIQVEHVRALIRLLYPDEMTPRAKALFDAALHEAEFPPDEDLQQVAT